MLSPNARPHRQAAGRRPIARVLLAAALFSVPALAERADHTTDEEDILQAAREAREASRTYDGPTLDRLLAADFLAIDAAGELRNRADFIGMIRDLPPELKAANAKLKVVQRDPRVRQYGNVAVLTELREVEGSSTPSKARYMQVWVKEEGRWRLSTFQVTRVAAPQ